MTQVETGWRQAKKFYLQLFGKPPWGYAGRWHRFWETAVWVNARKILSDQAERLMASVHGFARKGRHIDKCEIEITLITGQFAQSETELFIGREKARHIICFISGEW